MAKCLRNISMMGVFITFWQASTN